MLVWMRYEGLDSSFVRDQSGGWVPVGDHDGAFRMITEIQFLLPEWMAVKKKNALQYKITRARDMSALVQDLAKYLPQKQTTRIIV